MSEVVTKINSIAEKTRELAVRLDMAAAEIRKAKLLKIIETALLWRIEELRARANLLLNLTEAIQMHLAVYQEPKDLINLLIHEYLDRGLRVLERRVGVVERGLEKLKPKEEGGEEQEVKHEEKTVDEEDFSKPIETSRGCPINTPCGCRCPD